MSDVEAPQAFEADLVRDFVANAHGDLEAVRTAVTGQPALANAAWDWGAGDWETGLGAAAHMGRRDIAEVLLAHGARLDVFAAAMLGEIEIVRAVVTAHPAMRDAKGPHGIPLRAQRGGRGRAGSRGARAARLRRLKAYEEDEGASASDVRSTSRVSKISSTSPSFTSLKPSRRMPHSKPSATSRTSSLNRFS